MERKCDSQDEALPPRFLRTVRTTIPGWEHGCPVHVDAQFSMNCCESSWDGGCNCRSRVKSFRCIRLERTSLAYPGDPPALPGRQHKFDIYGGRPSPKLLIVSHHAHERKFDDGRVRKPKPQQVGVQISCCVHSQVSQEDTLWGVETTPRGGVSQTGAAKGKPDRRRAPDAGSRSHDDFDSAEIRGLSGGRIYQRQECDPFGPCIRGEEAQFCGTAFLGEGVLRLDRRSRRSRDTGVHQKPGARG